MEPSETQTDSPTTATCGKTLKEQVDLFTRNPPLSIAHPLIHYARAKSFAELPRHNDFHWRGLWQPDPGYVHGMFSEG